jgi:hypothetical protein
MNLIKNWRDAWKWYSVWALSAATTVGGITAYLPPSALVAPVLFFPEYTWGSLIGAVVAVLGVSGLIGRVISQEPMIDVEVP